MFFIKGKRIGKYPGDSTRDAQGQPYRWSNRRSIGHPQGFHKGLVEGWRLCHLTKLCLWPPSLCTKAVFELCFLPLGPLWCSPYSGEVAHEPWLPSCTEPTATMLQPEQLWIIIGPGQLEEVTTWQPWSASQWARCAADCLAPISKIIHTNKWLLASIWYDLTRLKVSALFRNPLHLKDLHDQNSNQKSFLFTPPSVVPICSYSISHKKS